MSVGKVIETLETEIREYKRMIDERTLCLAGESAYEECQSRIDFDREIIALLRTHPDAQPNEQLTLEDLREMDGQPVVVVKGNDDPMWALVTVESVNDKFHEFFIECADGDELRFDSEGCNNFDGEEVIFYRRPPKEV